MSPTAVRRYGASHPRRRLLAWAVVAVVHGLALWALVAGTKRSEPEARDKPLQAVVLQEVILPPPPPLPPPPKPLVQAPKPPLQRIEAPAPVPPPAPPVAPPVVQAPVAPPVPPFVPPFVPPPDRSIAAPAAPSIATTPTLPSAPVVAAPPGSGPAPAVPAASGSPGAQIGVVCPTQVAPVMPRAAIRRGIEGMVRAEAVIRDGVVREVNILSGPRELHDAVRDAMRQYRCTSGTAEVRAMQEFNFRLQ